MNRQAKKLYNKAYKLWKEYAYARDGKICQVKLFYPFINICHTDIYQVDHVFSRSNKWLFFEPKNSLVICSACNMAKGFHNKSISRAVDEIFIQREGIEEFNRMKILDQSGKPNMAWGQIWYFEQVINELENK